VEANPKPITIQLNGKPVETVDGRILLDICREQGVHIPTLCHHEALSAAGACRLCAVEAKYKDWSKVVVSCIYPVWDGLEIETDNDRVHAVRKLVLEMLLARCPDVGLIQEMAREYGIEKPRFPTSDKECILCTLCVRACSEMVEVHALSMQSRGADKEVGLPYLSDESTCIGCGACVYVCPTECIVMEDRDDVRRIWHRDGDRITSPREFELQRCKTCGTLMGPKKQLRYITDKVGLEKDFYDICNGCRVTGKKPAAS